MEEASRHGSTAICDGLECNDSYLVPRASGTQRRIVGWAERSAGRATVLARTRDTVHSAFPSDIRHAAPDLHFSEIALLIPSGEEMAVGRRPKEVNHDTHDDSLDAQTSAQHRAV